MKVNWTHWDPGRLARDLREVAEFSPTLAFMSPGEPCFPHGGWVGALPLWPFSRSEPPGLRELVSEPLEVAVVCASAHPISAPNVIPTNVAIDVMRSSDTAWHVLPSGGLCLLQTVSQWDPAASVVELLLKAAGWRIEYALMEAGRLERMTERGIVQDSTLDALILHPGSIDG